jgi:hypothetical protein
VEKLFGAEAMLAVSPLPRGVAELFFQNLIQQV